jgi:hypothetical protein
MHTRRRELIAAGLTSAGAVALGAERPAAQEGDAAILQGIRDDLRALRAACCDPPPEIDRIRGVQNAFLRSTSKYPDVIEVGTRYWEVVYDWLHRSPQPMDVTQLANGRYGMRFGFTTLVLRTDAAADYLGPAQER